MDPTIGIVIWGILATVGGILNWYRSDRLYKQTQVAKDSTIELLRAEVDRLKQITPFRAHQELMGQKGWYETLLSKSQEAIDELTDELAGQGAVGALTEEQLKLAEEQRADLEKEVKRLRGNIERVPDIFAAINTSSGGLEAVLLNYRRRGLFGHSVVDPTPLLPPSKQNKKSLEED